MKQFAYVSLLALPISLAALGACSSSSSGNPDHGFDGGTDTDSGASGSDSGVATDGGGDGGPTSVVACGANVPSFNWARGSTGGSSAVQPATVNAGVNAIAVDSAGNAYVTGAFIGDATFLGASLTSTDKNLRTIFVAKLDPNGKLLWSKTFGGTGDDLGAGIGLDGAGNVFISGNYGSTVMFDTKSLTAATGGSAFVAKLSPADGTVAFASSIGSATTGSSSATFVNVDSAGNTIVGGSFRGMIALSGTITLVGDADAVPDAYIAKLDPTGAPLYGFYATGMGTGGGSFIGAITDASGNVYGAGNVKGQLVFPGPTTLIGDGTFFVKYDGAGDVMFSKQGTVSPVGGGTTSDLSIGGVAFDATGAAYLAGQFVGEASFNGLTVDSSGTGQNSLVMAYDNTGSPLWAKNGSTTGGATNGVSATSIAFDGTSSIYVGGTASAPGGVTIDTVDLPTTNGGFFLAKYDISGNVKYAGSNSVAAAGAGNAASGFAITANGATGGVYAGGASTLASSFGEFPFTASAGSQGDFWVARICN